MTKNQKSTIGQRVTEQLQQKYPQHSQDSLAKAIGMTTDAFSRAINEQRGFSALEIAKIAEELDVDIHWLITGDANPRKLKIIAHHCDFDTPY